MTCNLDLIENPCVEIPGFFNCYEYFERGKHITLLFP